MTPEEVRIYYGSQYQFQKKTGMSSATLGNWLKSGKVPKNAQYRLESITHGKLKTEWSDK